MIAIDMVRPCLPTRWQNPPRGDAWIHEIKWDGYRVMSRVGAGRGQVFTKNLHDWSDRFVRICEDILSLGCADLLIDGEAVVLDARGISDLSLLQRAVASGSREIRLVAFDLLFLDGQDLRSEPLVERRSRLAKLVGLSPGIILSEDIPADGQAAFEHACRIGLEGIVSKLKTSTYRSGRQRCWIKTKCPLA